MRKLFTLASIAALSLCTAATALAQAGKEDAAKKPGAAEQAKPAAPAMPVPKPPEEMAQLKGMLGTWKCDGKFSGGGMEMAMKSKATFTSELDGFAVVGVMESPKSKTSPGYKGRVMYSWDSAAKQFVAAGADNMGGSGHMTSKGWSGDSIEWAGKQSMMGQSEDSKETITKKGDKEVAITGSSGTGDKAAKWEMTCKK